MPVADILLLDPDNHTRKIVAESIAAMFYNVIALTTLDQAFRRVREGDLEAVVADWTTLAPSDMPPENPLSLTNRLRASMAQLRAQYAASAARNASAPSRQLQIIVTSSDANPAIHAAAISAGADAYLRVEDVLAPAVLESYLTQVVERSASAVLTAMATAKATVTDAAPTVAREDVASAFKLDDAPLRDAESGRWSAKRIAESLGVTLRALAGAVEVNYSTVAKTPDSVALQDKLAPFANVLAMVRDVYGGDGERLRKWLNSPQPSLKDATPLDAMMRPNAAPAVEQWVTGIWMGEAA